MAERSGSAGQVLTSEEVVLDLRAFSAIVNLKLLDKTWTDNARKPAGERQSLTPIVDEMAVLLTELEELLPQVFAISTKYREQLGQLFVEKQNKRTNDREAKVKELGEDIETSARVATERIAGLAEREISLLRAENAQLEGGYASAGDLTVDADLMLDAGFVHIELHLHLDTEDGGLGSLLAGVACTLTGLLC